MCYTGAIGHFYSVENDRLQYVEFSVLVFQFLLFNCITWKTITTPQLSLVLLSTAHCMLSYLKLQYHLGNSGALSSLAVSLYAPLSTSSSPAAIWDEQTSYDNKVTIVGMVLFMLVIIPTNYFLYDVVM